MLPPLEVDAGPFPRFPALLGHNAAATGLELSLALRSSKVPTPTLATNKRDAATASGLSRKALEAALQLSRIKVKNPNAAGTAVFAAPFSESAACLPARLSGAASGPSLSLAATRPLGATLLHPSAVSACSGPAESLAAAVAALLAWEFLWLGRLPLLLLVLLLRSNLRKRSVVGLLKTQQN